MLDTQRCSTALIATVFLEGATGVVRTYRLLFADVRHPQGGMF
jgi:hypothetical protein